MTAPAEAYGQSDSVAYHLDELVVVGEGTATTLRESVAAATVLTREQIDATPARVLPDLLRHVPGLVFLERDGAGDIPLSIARGFFGGGETEYMLVMLDGVPLNDLRTGAVDWTRIRPNEVERVEVLRGGGSAVYGDQAVGAVVNVITRGSMLAPRWNGLVSGGAWRDVELAGTAGTPLGPGNVEGSLNLSRSSGYRDHSDASVTSFGASWGTRDPARTRWSVDARYSSHINQDAGPLRAADVASDRRQANRSFGDDERDRRLFELAGRVSGPTSRLGELTGEIGVQVVEQEQVRTILLTPTFGDTQLHDEGSVTARARALLDRRFGGLTLTAGAEASIGSYESSYFGLDNREDPASEGRGSRGQGAVAASAEWLASERIKAVAGGRFDLIRVDNSDTDLESTFDQLSPRLGINVAYSLERGRTGHVYASWGRSFKAPTLDQLYDARSIPVGPDAVVNLSNPDLQPQRSTDVELGLYQTFPVWSGRSADLSVAVYRIDLEDEIDFDLATFSYANIQESRHAGVEAALNLPIAGWLLLRHSLTVGNAEFGIGEFKGNQLKNIPRTAVVTSLRSAIARDGNLTVAWRHTGRMYLDDANRETISPRDVMDFSADWTVGGITVFVAIRNLFDAAGEEGGFLLPDPLTQVAERLLYPSGGRHARIGVRMEGGL